MAGAYLAAVVEGQAGGPIASHHIDGWTNRVSNAFVRKCSGCSPALCAC